MSKTAKVRTRKRGKTFSFIFEAGKDESGKRMVIEKGGFASEEIAYNAGIDTYNDYKHGNIGITSEKISMKEYLYSWIKNVVTGNMADTTVYNYENAVKRYIIPYVGSIYVQDLSPAMLDRWIRTIAANGYSKNTIQLAKAVLSHALNYAVYPCKLIAVNPIQYIKLPDAPKNIITRTIISIDMMKRIIEKYPFGSPYYIPIVIAYHTGMRAGEIIGLTWNNVDIENKSIHVMQQVKYSASIGNHFGKPKNESSTRTIMIDDILVAELRRWKSQQAANEIKCGKAYIYTYYKLGDHGKIVMMSKSIETRKNLLRKDIVCTRQNGKMVTRASFFDILHEEGINSHSFRHTHATQLIEGGAKAIDIAERLGHTNSSMVEKLYAHNTDKIKRETVNIFAKHLQTRPYADKLQTIKE